MKTHLFGFYAVLQLDPTLPTKEPNKKPTNPSHSKNQPALSEGEHVAGIQELQGDRHVMIGPVFFGKEDIGTCRQYQDFCLGMPGHGIKNKKKMVLVRALPGPAQYLKTKEMGGTVRWA